MRDPAGSDARCAPTSISPAPKIGRVSELSQGVARARRTLVRGLARLGGPAWSWAKDKVFHRPSAFQTSSLAREKEDAGGVAAMLHPRLRRPTLPVPEE
ncbi:MAG: hypothetical protein M1826_005107 [Phylliscum demangeonii]|nr:MAG: hypothetical protein M1826_005107 [Phylliscum demangeonii]